jgi:endonuclease/exonuclease/phosphatase (EEP) superfamily protein YafD
VPPLRLDHVLYGDAIVARAVHETEGAGSDHRPVVADLALVSADR